MIIGLLCVSLSIPESCSLKDKRRILLSLKDRTAKRMNVSAAEVDKQDSWKSARLAFVTVSAQKTVAERRLAQVSTIVRSNPRCVVTDLSVQFL